MLVCEFLPVLGDHWPLIIPDHLENVELEVGCFLLSPLLSDFVGFELGVGFEKATDCLAAPFIRVRDPMSIIPFLLIDLMEEPLMKVTIGVLDLESQLV